jgi:hypothetical protein
MNSASSLAIAKESLLAAIVPIQRTASAQPTAVRAGEGAVVDVRHLGSGAGEASPLRLAERAAVSTVVRPGRDPDARAGTGAVVRAIPRGACWPASQAICKRLRRHDVLLRRPRRPRHISWRRRSRLSRGEVRLARLAGRPGRPPSTPGLRLRWSKVCGSWVKGPRHMGAKTRRFESSPHAECVP